MILVGRPGKDGKKPANPKFDGTLEETLGADLSDEDLKKWNLTRELVDQIKVYGVEVSRGDSDTKFKFKAEPQLDENKDIWVASYNWKAFVNVKGNKSSKMIKACYDLDYVTKATLDLSPLQFTNDKSLMWIDALQHIGFEQLSGGPKGVVSSMVYVYQTFKTLPLFIMPKALNGDDPDKAMGRGWVTQEIANGLEIEEIAMRLGEEAKKQLDPQARKKYMLELAFKYTGMQKVLAETKEDNDNPRKVAMKVVRALSRARFSSELDRYVTA